MSTRVEQNNNNMYGNVMILFIAAVSSMSSVQIFCSKHNIIILSTQPAELFVNGVVRFFLHRYYNIINIRIAMVDKKKKKIKNFNTILIKIKV